MKHLFLMIFLSGQLLHAMGQEAVIVARFGNMNVKQIEVLNNDYSNPEVLFKKGIGRRRSGKGK